MRVDRCRVSFEACQNPFTEEERKLVSAAGIAIGLLLPQDQIPAHAFNNAVRTDRMDYGSDEELTTYVDRAKEMLLPYSQTISTAAHRMSGKLARQESCCELTEVKNYSILY